MGDISDLEQSETVRIVGNDESFAVDVIDEDGLKKLIVKPILKRETLGNKVTLFALNGGSGDLTINGSGTEFIIPSNATGDLVIKSLVFEALDGGMRMQNFLGKNSALTNGVVVEIKSEDNIFQFSPITKTIDFDSLFASGASRSFEIFTGSGNDSMVARFGESAPFVIKQSGTYTVDDYIKVIINDDLRSVGSLRFLADGSLE